MFARILEIVPKMEKKEELIQFAKKEVLPILRKQYGFLDFLPFVPEDRNEAYVTITLWNDKKDFERYEREWFAKIEEMVKPYLNAPVVVRNNYTVETTLCEHFEKALAA